MVEDLSNLYQEVILEAAKDAHGRKEDLEGGALAPSSHCAYASGFNPSCGDEVEIKVETDGEAIKEVSWKGEGCAICTASLSIMTDLVEGKSRQEALSLYKDFLGLMNGRGAAEAPERLKDAAAFKGVAKFPMRIKCALLGWTTLKEALGGEGK
ncbi:MAG: SUF system NifU family Fe-S cluster assembly protein [Aeriscardovia sp.]|nr:SUF system NifU family Fe-S cluster assembly protein [Aeriscardovia sp.]